EGLKEYFSKFGDLKECMVMRDPVTKRSRGFGFVTYVDQAGVDKVLAQPRHELDSKTLHTSSAIESYFSRLRLVVPQGVGVRALGAVCVTLPAPQPPAWLSQMGLTAPPNLISLEMQIDPKVAFPRRAQPKVGAAQRAFTAPRSFSLRVPDRLSALQVDDAMLMFDKTTNRHRGFGFVTFENEDVVEKVCEIHFHEINNKMVRRKRERLCVLMSPTGSARGRSRVMPYGMDAFMLGIGMLGYPGFQAATYASRGYTGITPGYTYQFPEFHLERTPLLTSPHPPEITAIPLTAYGPMAAAAAAAAVVRGTGSTASRSGGFLGASSPGPMADLYGANQDSGVSSYISAASPAPSTGFGHSLGVSLSHGMQLEAGTPQAREQLIGPRVSSRHLSREARVSASIT
ncbi:MSI1H protein, partial [Atractosteus spatula]|nr:MSI1H protein [Atractosteus spatula]